MFVCLIIVHKANPITIGVQPAPFWFDFRHGMTWRVTLVESTSVILFFQQLPQRSNPTALGRLLHLYRFPNSLVEFSILCQTPSFLSPRSPRYTVDVHTHFEKIDSTKIFFVRTPSRIVRYIFLRLATYGCKEPVLLLLFFLKLKINFVLLQRKYSLLQYVTRSTVIRTLVLT